MKVILNVASFKVPSNQRTVMTTCIYKLIVSVIGNAHYVIRMSIYQWLYFFNITNPLYSFLGSTLLQTTSSSFSSAHICIFLSHPTAITWAIFSVTVSGSNAQATPVISQSTCFPESSLSSSVRHYPLLKFHILAVPSLPVEMSRLWVESKQPAVILAF